MSLCIITINYNNAIGLELTIKSVYEQSFKSFEYIVIDGGSTDNSLSIIKRYEKTITKWISEKDNGIYNAMNKAVKICNSNYCLFLNSGDILYNNTTIEELMKINFTQDIILGSVIGKFGLIKAPSNIGMYKLFSNSISHQASIIKRELLLKYPYDENLRIVSDWKFCIQTLIINNCSYLSIPNKIAIEETGGVSSFTSNTHKAERVKVLNELIPLRIINDYYKFNKFPFRIILRLLYGNN